MLVQAYFIQIDVPFFDSLFRRHIAHFFAVHIRDSNTNYPLREERNRGKLDPLLVGLPELREELASSYLLELLRDPPPAWENAIDRAVRDAVRAGERSLTCVVSRLRASEAEAAREAGDALEVLSDFGLARLGFAPAGEAA